MKVESNKELKHTNKLTMIVVALAPITKQQHWIEI
jgi:hypothetical protein